jgi:hypothetical protein
MKKLIVLFCIVIAACKTKEHIPSDILSQDKMQSVVWDMMRADQYLGDFVFPTDTSLNKDSQSIRMYQQVLAIHQLSKEEFTRSWNYYKAHPALMQQIMDTVSRKQVNASPIVTPLPDSNLTLPPPVKKHIPIPDSVLHQRRKKVLQAQ